MESQPVVFSPDLAKAVDAARSHWTPARLDKLVHGKKLLILPSEGAALLRVMGLIARDGTMAAANTKKYLQINHMLALVKADLDRLASEHAVVRVLDACCGSSFMALLVAWYIKERLGKACEIVGIDRNAAVIAASRQRAVALGFESFVKFEVGELGGVTTGPRFHLTLALHACDVATDYALAEAIRNKSDVIAIAPCCQRELAALWEGHGGDDHALAPVFATPNLRREAAATMTDTLRMLSLRGAGYEVTATEFVPAAHTPKNRLLLARRRGNYHTPSQTQFERLKAALGGPTLTLERLLSDSGVAPGVVAH